MGAEVFHTLKAELKKAGHNTNVGDEGGFAPNLPNAEAALDFVVEGDRQGRLQGRRGRRAGARLRLDRVLQERQATSMKAKAKPARISQQVKYLADLVATLSDRLHRRRHGRRRLGRLEAAHRRRSATSASSSATICSSPTSSGLRTASRAAARTRSWSRSIRSAR